MNNHNGQHVLYNNYSYSTPNLSALSSLSSSPTNSGLVGYPSISTSNPPISTSNPSSPSTKHSQLISGPPASHYMHNT
jgi:hypothetical protein